MDSRLHYRLVDILDALDQLELLLDPLTFDDFVSDRVKRAACERFLEIASEATRHIPQAHKEQHPGIPWKQIADMGNHLRHAYHAIDPEILWQIHSQRELGSLARAARAILRANEASGT